MREEEYFREQEKERKEKEVKSASSHISQKDRKQTPVEKDTTNISVVKQQTFELDETQIVSKLRQLDQPIRLFGETDEERLVRFKKLDSMEERAEPVLFSHLLQATEQDLTEDLLQGVKPDEPVRKELLDKDAEVDTTIICLKLLKEEREKNLILMTVFLKRLIREWGLNLQKRPDEEKRSPQGKLATVTQGQVLEHMKPFFKGIKKNTHPDDVLERITEICMYIQQREYTQANDSYIRLSIGNAAWPIGVTAVGIHERSGREKLHTSQIAHALNDETQRKWIQSIKRLMTYAQSVRPPSDVSKLVG
ncbi:Prp18 domain-containing protein [Globomyces pollinis-pini]|nr:Prp18 domain-containing protein [Globomyces pollinis-pini]